jgi:hypothetical protein
MLARVGYTQALVCRARMIPTTRKVNTCNKIILMSIADEDRA